MTRAHTGRTIFAASWLLVGLMMAAPWAAAQAPASQASRPIAALSDFSLRAVPVSKEVASALKGLLHAKLAASGAFRLVPEKTLGEKLRALKKETLRACGDQGCLMELGQALAASHVIQPELVRVADRCMVALTIYDVRSATSELATTEECACQESGFLSAALKAGNALAQAFALKGAPTTSASPRRFKGKVSIFVSSKPSFAPLWVDGEQVGRTPKLLSLTKGVTHRLKIGAWPHRPVERVVTPQRWQRLHLRLALDRDDAKTVATTREWFAFGFLGGWSSVDNEPLFGAELRIWQQRWKHLVWTAFEARYIGAVSGDSDAPERSFDTIVTLATRAAYPLYWGRHGTHQLQLGLGAGYWYGGFSSGPNIDKSRSAFAVLPSLHYLWLLGNGGFSIGLGFDVTLPLRSGIGGKEAPIAFTFGLTFGLSGEANMRADAQGKIPPEQKKRWKNR